MSESCLITGTVVDGNNNPKANAVLTVTPIAVTGALVHSKAIKVRSGAEGVLPDDFELIQGAQYNIRGDVLGFERAGQDVTIPESDDAELLTLLAAVSVPSQGVMVKDEGTALSTLVSVLNFVGSGVTVTQPSGGVATVTIAASGAWGSITGTLSNQSDLQTALNAKLTQAQANGLYSAIGHNHAGVYQPVLGYTAANDSAVVHKTGDESIAGIKTFTGDNIFEGFNSFDDAIFAGAVDIDNSLQVNSLLVQSGVTQLAQGTNAFASLNIPDGAAPDAPNIGDFWLDASRLTYYDGSANRAIAHTGDLSGLALDASVVHLAGFETITGEKEFSNTTYFATISQGVWEGTPIADGFIASAATWNAKEDSANKATNFAVVNDTLFPTVAAVKSYADSLVVGLLDDRGSYNASGNTFPASGGSGAAGAILKGDLWFISVAGTLGGAAVAAGDQVRALVDTPGQTAGNWAISEGNVGFVPENVANKATSFVTLNHTLYPTTQAVSNFVVAGYQPLSANLTTYAGIAPSTNVQTLLGAANFSAFRTSLGVAIGSDVQAFNQNLADIAGLADPNADRILFWDDSAGAHVYLTLGSNLSITGTTINAAGGSPGGSDTQLQRNNAGAFGGISGATSDGTNVTFGSGNLLATRPKVTTSIDDVNGNEMIIFSAVASAVNEFTFWNSASSNPLAIVASGSSANLDIQITPKGSGKVDINNGTLAVMSGSVGAPSIAFRTLPTYGLYLNSGVGIASAGTDVARFTHTGSGIFYFIFTNAASGGTVSMVASAPAVAAAGVVGTPMQIRASDATAGSSSAGAVAGGALTLQSGDAKRLTSGNAAGGNVNVTCGAGIGTSIQGKLSVSASQALFPSGTQALPGISFVSATDTGFWNAGSTILISAAGVDVGQIFGAGGGQIELSSGVLLSWASGASAATAADTALGRNAAAIIEANNGTAGQWAALKVGTRSATQDSIENGLTIGRQTSGTQASNAAGLGAAIGFTINSTTTADQNAAQIAAAWSVATHASRSSYVQISVVEGAGALAAAAKFDKTAVAGETGLWLWDADNGQLERVKVGAADSGGAGFKVLRIAN